MARTIQEKSKVLEALLENLCETPYETMAVLDYCKNRFVVYVAQIQFEARNNKDKPAPKIKEKIDAPEKNSSGDERRRVRAVSHGSKTEQEVPGSGSGEVRKRPKRRRREAAQGDPGPAREAADVKPDTAAAVDSGEPAESVGSGLPPAERNYRIPRPGDPDYVAPAPRDRKPKPARPGEDIPFESPAPPDPTDPSVMVRGKGKTVGCSSCSTKGYTVKENIPQTTILNDALKLFTPVDVRFAELRVAADVNILENGAICIDCPSCGMSNGITLIPVQTEMS